MKKLAIITSHPIQYNAPLFRLLTERKRIVVKVFYTWGQTKDGMVYDPDFKKEFTWDIPLLDGYEKEFIENISRDPGAGHFNGIKNKDLVQRIDQYDPDALLVFGWSFQSHLQVLRHYRGRKKILFRGDSTLLDETAGFSWRKLSRRLLLRWVYRHIDLALFTGEANRQYFLQHGLRKDQLIYAPHAVENQRFFDVEGVAASRAAAWRKELLIPGKAIVFLFAGKLEPKKDPLLLLQSFMTLENPDARLIFVGNGVLEPELKEKAVHDQRVLFLDFQNQQQMPVVYRLGDVFVLPSKGPGETWGLGVNEAMACSRAVIVSDKCGCAADLVRGNGLVFEAGKKEHLQRALLYFATKSIEITEMGHKSLQFIRQFSHEQVAAAIEQSI